MRWTRIIASAFCAVALLGSSSSLAAAQATPGKPAPVTVELPPPPKPLLPDAFAGWVAAETPKTVTDPAQADSANVAALKEYGFTDAVLANYKRDGETLTVRALSFHRYQRSVWCIHLLPPERLAQRRDRHRSDFEQEPRAVLGRHHGSGCDVLADRSNVAAELRELAQQLPAALGNKAIAPPILSNLPQASLDKQTTHYALGPAGYAGAGGVLPPDLVGFDRGAEAVTANYSLASNPATLTIIDYPTPQMAEAQETKIRDYIKAGSAGAAGVSEAARRLRPGLARSAPQRTARGSRERRRHSRREPQAAWVSPLSGRAGLDSAADRIRSQQDQQAAARHRRAGDRRIASAAILLGFFLGGGRALYRIARGKPASSVYETEFIRLNLQK